MKFEKLFGEDSFLIGKVTSNKKIRINFKEKCVVDVEMKELEQARNEGLK